MNRLYTGYDKTASGKRAGFEMLVKLLSTHFGLWNNGTWGVRDMRGKPGKPSVHATGRAGDLSWRGAPHRGTGNYQDAVRMMDFLVEHADELGVEAVFDYYPQPWGRGWKCDRGAWQVYSSKAFSGAPGGDWVHVEISNEFADNPQHYVDFFAKTLGDTGVKVTAQPEADPAPTPAPAGKEPWLQVGSRGDQVKKVQEVVGAQPVDGIFGPKTEAAVRAWQAANDLHVDGVVGPKTWAEMNAAPSPAPEPAQTAPQPAQGGAMAYPGPPMITRGSKETEAVKAIQAKVGAKVDGQFGPQTRDKVRDWQSANGLHVDGIVGAKTWKAMFG